MGWQEGFGGGRKVFGVAGRFLDGRKALCVLGSSDRCPGHPWGLPQEQPQLREFQLPTRMGDLRASAPRNKSVLGSLPNPFLPFLGQEAGKPSQPLCLSWEDLVASAGIDENCGGGSLEVQSPSCPGSQQDEQKTRAQEKQLQPQQDTRRLFLPGFE